MFFLWGFATPKIRYFTVKNILRKTKHDKFSNRNIIDSTVSNISVDIPIYAVDFSQAPVTVSAAHLNTDQ